MSVDYVQTAPAPLFAKQFVQSIGVNAHMNYFDTAYGNLSIVESALAYLGIHSVRVGAVDFAAYGQYSSAACCCRIQTRFRGGGTNTRHLCVPGFAVSNLSRQRRFDRGSKRSRANPGFFDGGTALTNEVELQQSIYDYVHSDQNITGIPVVDLTLGISKLAAYSQAGNLSSAADEGNAHIYAPYGNTRRRISSVLFCCNRCSPRASRLWLRRPVTQALRTR